MNDYAGIHLSSLDFHDEDSFDSNDDISEDGSGEKIECAPQSDSDSPLKLLKQSHTEVPNDDERDSRAESEFDSAHFKQDNDGGSSTLFEIMQADFPNYHKDGASSPEPNLDGRHYVNMQSKNTKLESALPPRQTHTLSVLTIFNREALISPDVRTDSPIEPRVAMRKLKEELDKNERQEEMEDFRKNDENATEENDDVLIIGEIKPQEEVDQDIIPGVIELDNDENNAKANLQTMDYFEILSNHIKVEKKNFTICKELAEKETMKVEKQEENIQNPPNKISKKKNKKCKKEKKKESQKSKRRRCQIM